MNSPKNLVPLDSLTYAELKHLIGKSAPDLTEQQMGMIAAGLVKQQGGLEHEKAQAWEQGKADYIQGQRYPFIGAHLVNPFENEETP